MANRVKGEVTLGKGHKMKFDSNAIAEMEDQLNMPFDVILQNIEGRMNMRLYRAIVWASLIHQHEDENGNYDLTLKDAGKIMDDFGLETVMEKVMTALDLYMPDDDPEKPQSLKESPKQNREQRRKAADSKNE